MLVFFVDGQRAAESPRAPPARQRRRSHLRQDDSREDPPAARSRAAGPGEGVAQHTKPAASAALAARTSHGQLRPGIRRIGTDLCLDLRKREPAPETRCDQKTGRHRTRPFPKCRP